MINATMEMAPAGQQLLHDLQTEGWNDQELANFAKAWNISNTDLEAIQENPKLSDRDKEIRTAILAAEMSHAINVRMRVSTPAILSATPKDLLEWIDFYYAEANRLYNEVIDAQLNHPEGKAHGNPAFDEAFTQFHRICGFLWECEEHAGVHQLMQVVDKVLTE